MALSVNLDWYIRSTATGTNSGGFDDSVTSPGTNWADADSSQATGTNLTVDGSDNTIVTPDGHTPTSADNGNVVVVTTASGGWTAGYYTIASNDGTSWTLDRSPAATSVASGAWSVGGAFVDGVPLGMDSAAATITSPLAAGHQVNVRGDGSDDPSTVHVQASAGYRNMANGTIQNPIRIIGYNGRPHWKAGASTCLTFYGIQHWYVENMKFTINGTSNGSYGMLNTQHSVVHDCIFDFNGNADCSAVKAGEVTDCEFRNSGSKTPGATTLGTIVISSYGTKVEGCAFIDIVGPVWHQTTDGHNTTFINNFIIRNFNTVAAVHIKSNTTYPGLIAGNTFHDCDGDAIRCIGDYAIGGSAIRNNIFTIAGGYFINQETSANLNPNVYDYNTFGAGTMGATSGVYNNYSGGANDVTMASDLDPYTNKASEDFSLDDTNGTNAKANAFPGSIRGLSTTNYKDRGAAQREEAGGTVVIVNNRRRI